MTGARGRREPPNTSDALYARRARCVCTYIILLYTTVIIIIIIITRSGGGETTSATEGGCALPEGRVKDTVVGCGGVVLVLGTRHRRLRRLVKKKNTAPHVQILYPKNPYNSRRRTRRASAVRPKV